MKDFDDFAQLVDRTTDQDMARIFANVIEQMNLPKDANGNVSFSVEDLMPFSTAVSNARTMALLRKYHEWANAEERELLYAFCAQAAYRLLVRILLEWQREA